MRPRLGFSKIAALALVICQPLTAETPVSLTQGTSGSWNADWNGVAYRTDFFQWSLDLVDWHFAPVVEYGTGVKSYGFTSSTDKFFVRLEHAYISSTDPEGDDYDYDSLSNIDEVTLHDTDPLKWDTDGDLLSDDWEIANNLDPRDDGSINPDNGASGDPDGDGVDNHYEYLFAGNPHLSDTDGDGLSDSDELFIYSTSLAYADSDEDGLNDYAEVITYSTDPFWWDSDDDTLTDGDEVLIYSTNPLKVDSDGDWMWDDWEVDNGLDPTDAADGLLDADSDGLANQLEFVFIDKGFDPFTADATGFPWSGDPDYDGLTTAQEFNVHLTNPRQTDTDSDRMDDGWEIQFSFNAKINNATDVNANNDAGADPDGDNLTNEQESTYGTNPADPDTDGDGVNDDVEVNQGSNPNDPNDHDPPPGGTVAVSVNFGDHSDSHSEKYCVILTPLEGDPTGPPNRKRTNRQYGNTQTDTFRLPKGSKYKVELQHAGTNPNYRGTPNPDYDYTLNLSSDASITDSLAISDDPNGMLGEHNESSSFFASGKSATLYVAYVSSETVAVIPTNWQRTDLGVGEEVDLEIAPYPGSSAWSTSTGTLDQTTGPKSRLTLADATGSATVTVYFPGKTLTKTFTIFAPTGYDVATVASTDSLPSGLAGSGMTLDPVYISPTTVSFYKVEILEVGQSASNITGYFTDPNHPPPSHNTANGANKWIQLGQSNECEDHAALGSTNCPSPWTTGTFTWVIPVKWKVVNSLGTSPEHTITGWNQEFSINSSGTASVKKFGKTVTRTTLDFSVHD